MLMTNVPNVIAACCNNICEIHGDEFNDEWMQELKVMPRMEPSQIQVMLQVASRW